MIETQQSSKPMHDHNRFVVAAIRFELDYTFAAMVSSLHKKEWSEGEPLNGRVRAEDEFSALDDVDDEDLLD